MQQHVKQGAHGEIMCGVSAAAKASWGCKERAWSSHCEGKGHADLRGAACGGQGAGSGLIGAHLQGSGSEEGGIALRAAATAKGHGGTAWQLQQQCGGQEGRCGAAHCQGPQATPPRASQR